MKKLVISLVVVLTLVVTVVLLAPLLLSSDTLRQQFAKNISSVSGMDIVLDGPVNFKVFPNLGLVASDIGMTSADGNLSVSVSKIIASVKLASVFSDTIEITGLSLDQPQLAITTPKNDENTAVNVESGTNQTAASDPFAEIVNQLERLSLARLTIRDGKFISILPDGSQSIVSQVNAQLEAPDLDGEININADAVFDNQTLSFNATLAALRPILERQPAKIDLAMKLTPPPHPVLADLTASGIIQLSQDGSYQIEDGVFTSLGQPLRLNARYQPGARPYAALRLSADSLDLGSTLPATSDQQSARSSKQTSGALLDIQPLRNLDAEIQVQIDSLTMDNIQVRDIDLGLNLDHGMLEVNLGNAGISTGEIAAILSSDLNQNTPEFSGSLKASKLKIGDLAKLAGSSSPLKGIAGINLNYRFVGVNLPKIKQSFNFSGTANLTNGEMKIPALAGFGQNTDTLSDLEFTANFQDLQKPINVKGQLNWNRENININVQISPRKFIEDNAGNLSLALKSRKLNAEFDGELNLEGSGVGKAKISTNSLGNLLAWIGQGKNSDLKQFSYTGNISFDADSFAFDKSRFGLNDIVARGSGALSLFGKPSLVSNLSFDTLNLNTMLGETSGTGTGQSNSAGGAIDLSALKNFDANLKLKAKRIIYGKIVTGAVATQLVVKNGVARIKLPKMAFYSGQLSADITANGSQKTPSIKIDADLSNVSTLAFFDAAADFNRLEGKLSGQAKLSGSGKTSDQIIRSLAGSTRVKFTDGAIRGIDIAKIYNNLTAILSGGFKENQRDKTSFTELGLSFAIDRGIATTKDIKLLGPLVRMDGAGQVNLGSETIDMRLNPLVVLTTAGQGGKFDVGGAGFPVYIKGPLAKPKVYPDLQQLIKNPQVALDFMSKLGLNLKGVGKGAEGGIEGVIGNLISKNSPLKNLPIKDLPIENLPLDKLPGDANPGELMKSVIGNFLNPGNSKSDREKNTKPEDQTSVSSQKFGLPISGGIPVPVPNPRGNSKKAPPGKTVKEQVVEKIVPQLKLPVDNDTASKTLNGLLNNILQ